MSLFVIVFLHFLQSGTHPCLVHFMNKITYSASLPLPSFPSLNHTVNLTHQLATIYSNNPFPSLCHSTNKRCIKGPMSEGVLWGLTLSLYFSAFSKIMGRDKYAHNHWLLIAQTQKISISLAAVSEGNTCDQNRKPYTPPHLTSSTPPSPQKDQTLIQSLVLRLSNLLSRTCVLFQSVPPIDNSSLNIRLHLVVTCIRQQCKICSHSPQQSIPSHYQPELPSGHATPCQKSTIYF